mgnify:FL=1
MTTEWQRLADADQIASRASAIILRAAQKAIAAHGQFRIVLAGGSTPTQVYRQLARAETDWSRWQVYFGDERCLPADNAERNSRMATHAWLSHVDIPQDNIHTIHAELGAVRAAHEYATIIDAALPFDLVLLGMGEDGHTASLFPGDQHSANESVHAVSNAPKPPPERVSLSRASLSNSQQVLVLVSGASKHDALQRWRAGNTLPIATITALRRLVVLYDDQAAGQSSE